MKRALSQTQANELWRAASLLPPAARDQFIAAVDHKLVGIARKLNDDDVNGAIVATLSTFTTSQQPQEQADGQKSLRS